MINLIFSFYLFFSFASVHEIPIGSQQTLFIEKNEDLSIYLLEQRTLTPVEKQIAKEILLKTQDDGLRFLLKGLLDHDFSEPFELLFDQNEKSYKSLCSSIGKQKSGSFTDEQDRRVTKAAVVGSPQSGCYGRCGSQCGNGNERRYTQECLNHDLCHRTLDRQLGPCKDEFWAAAPGFFSAPNCN